MNMSLFCTTQTRNAKRAVHCAHHPHAYDRPKRAWRTIWSGQRLERPNYFGPLDASDSFDHDSRSFRRGAWWQHAVDEAKAIRETAGLIDATAFTKHMVKGPGAAAFLDWVYL